MVQLSHLHMLLLLLSHFSHVWLCATAQTAVHQAPPSLGFSRQEHWSGLPFPSPMHGSEKWKWSHSVITGKTVALTILPFVGKMMSLLFNMLSRFVISFLPRSKCPLILWLQPLSAVILGSRKVKSVTASKIHHFWSILVHWFLRCQCSLLPTPLWPRPIFLN